MNSVGTTILFFVLLGIAVYLSIPKGMTREKSNEIVRQSQEAGMSERQRIIQNIAEANERAHQRNHAEKCQLLNELASRRRSAINYGPDRAQISDGDEIIDAEAVEVKGFLGRG